MREAARSALPPAYRPRLRRFRNGGEATTILRQAGSDTVIRSMADSSGNQILLRSVHSQTEPLRTFTGFFEQVGLSFTPDLPVPDEERSQYKANYPTSLAFLHIYLDGEDATRQIPSGYLLPILEGLLVGTAGIISGQLIAAMAHWYSDPWQLELQGDLAHDRIILTLESPGRWVAMRDVELPLARFAWAVIAVAEQWAQYLEIHYHGELADPEKGKAYEQFLDRLRAAKASLQAS